MGHNIMNETKFKEFIASCNSYFKEVGEIQKSFIKKVPYSFCCLILPPVYLCVVLPWNICKTASISKKFGISAGQCREFIKEFSLENNLQNRNVMICLKKSQYESDNKQYFLEIQFDSDMIQELIIGEINPLTNPMAPVFTKEVEV